MDAEERRRYLGPTRFIDSDHPDVIARAQRLPEGCASERENLERIYHFGPPETRAREIMRALDETDARRSGPQPDASDR